MVKDEDREHKQIYYVSKVLQGVEIRYSIIAKLAITVLTIAKKMKLYFHINQVIILIN